MREMTEGAMAARGKGRIAPTSWLALFAAAGLFMAGAARSLDQAPDPHAAAADIVAPSDGAESADASAGRADAGFASTDAQEFIMRNCLSCHNEIKASGNLNLADADLSDLGKQLAIWETVARRVGGGEMPPADARRKPTPEQAATFAHWLVGALDQYALANPDPGRPVLRRLDRAEYTNAVRDLLAVDLDYQAFLPPDTMTDGFHNNGEAMSMSPMAMEKYLGVARRVARQAVGDPTLPRTIYDFPVPDDQMGWSRGLPFGARGGIAVAHYFPISGRYLIRAITDRPSKLPAAENRRRFEVTAQVAAGAHSIVVTMAEDAALTEGSIRNIRSEGGPATPGPIDPTQSLRKYNYLDFRIGGRRLALVPVQPPTLTELNTQNGLFPGQTYINRVEIDGPYDAVGPGMTASRKRIFVCMPRQQRQEEACARRILGSITRRAFRRDVTDADIAPFMAMFAQARAGTSFEYAIQEALQSILVAPEFLFRVEAGPAPATVAGTTYPVDDFALATRLSFFLWSSIPDDELLDLASAGRLHDPAVLDAQARRMLKDPRARALVDNFGMQYLGLGNLADATPDLGLFPDFTDVLRDQFREETRLFLQSIFANDRPVTDIVGASYTYLNENLARHYGIRNVYGPQFRRVDFQPDDVRGGILGQGSVLLMTSHPNQTSPVLRGKWVLANLLNSAPPPPPPGVPALEAANADGKPLTAREQMEQHRTNPACSGCHARMDPYGFALENLDVVGRWRDREPAGQVDATVTMPDGATFTGIVGLRNRLMDQKDALAQAFSARLFSYAMGRQLKGYDWPVVRQQIVAKAPGYRFDDIVVAIVNSNSFRFKRSAEPAQTAQR